MSEPLTAAEVQRLAEVIGLPVEAEVLASVAEQLTALLAAASGREVFRDLDVVLTPTAVDGIEVMTRGHLGVFTQPLSFVGLPVISVPVADAGPLPLACRSWRLRSWKRGCSGLRRGWRPTASSPRRSRRRAPRLWARALSDRAGRAAPR